MRHLRFLLVGGLLFASALRPLPAGELPAANPEDVGLSGSKLEQANRAVQALVDNKEVAGAVVMVARRGKVGLRKAFGVMDVDSGESMKPDAIVRIYSMSKPITTVAAMMLWEEGRFQLDDPVSQYLPALKGVRVASGEGERTVPAQREMTVRDLMRHTSGLTYGSFGDTPIDKLYREKKVLDRDDTLEVMVEKLGKIPLLYQPGTRFHYSVSTDVLGRLVEVASGKPLDSFFAERIFAPLDMTDSGFFVPEAKLGRFAANHGPGTGSGPKVIDAAAQSRYRSRPKLLSGGGGLVSTARDYMRFCQMLLNEGELDSKRLLRKETVGLMTHNQLPEGAMPVSLRGVKQPGRGFGLGFAVRVDDDDPLTGQAAGEYGWGGAASTHFWIVPRQELAVVALEQFMPLTLRLQTTLKPIVYEAVGDRKTSPKE